MGLNFIGRRILSHLAYLGTIKVKFYLLSHINGQRLVNCYQDSLTGLKNIQLM